MENDSSIPLHRRGLREVVKKVQDDQFGRERWQVDYEVYDKQDEEDAKIDPKYSRTTRTLQARNEKLGIEDEVGKKRLCIKEGPKKDQAGFHCPVCDDNFMDSITWIDHLNSQKHNRLLGMNMQVEKVGPEAIKLKLQSARKESVVQKAIPKTSMQEIEQKVIEDLQKRKERKQIQKSRQFKNFDNEINEIIQGKQKTQNKKIIADQNQSDDEQLLEMQKFGLPTQLGGKIKR